MNLGIGSKVKFLNEKGGGIIRGFKDDKFALVETEDGFEVPVLVTELIHDEQVSYDINGKVTSELAKKPAALKKKTAKIISFEDKKFASFTGNVLLAIVPENEQILHVSNFGLYIINNSNYQFIYLIGFRDQGAYTYIRSGAIDPGSKKEISKYSQSEIAKIKEFRLQGLFYKHGLLSFSQPVDLTFNIEEVSFYKIGYFKENEFFDKKALILNQEEFDLKNAVDKITSIEIAKVVKIKEQDEKNVAVKPKKEKIFGEVDLHIEEIVDDHKHLSNGEILEIQLGRFETALETALNANEPKVVFIHGIGNGKLKHELRKKLERKYPQLKFQDASFKEYGYGATMVYLK